MEEQDPQIQLNDLVAVVNILDLAASRGAFRIEEYSAVGATYQKIVEFLKKSGVINSNPPENSDSEQPKEE